MPIHMLISFHKDTKNLKENTATQQLLECRYWNSRSGINIQETVLVIVVEIEKQMDLRMGFWIQQPVY